ncbi:hypothetical protein C8R44DRAFT_754626 [Mycena epipterygia]|nr:hypothetical protein C8R44DRAFT_754626 [Mycena epipterygia]
MIQEEFGVVGNACTLPPPFGSSSPPGLFQHDDKQEREKCDLGRRVYAHGDVYERLQLGNLRSAGQVLQKVQGSGSKDVGTRRSHCGRPETNKRSAEDNSNTCVWRSKACFVVMCAYLSKAFGRRQQLSILNPVRQNFRKGWRRPGEVAAIQCSRVLEVIEKTQLSGAWPGVKLIQTVAVARLRQVIQRFRDRRVDTDN